MRAGGYFALAGHFCVNELGLNWRGEVPSVGLTCFASKPHGLRKKEVMRESPRRRLCGLAKHGGRVFGFAGDIVLI
jgi:hypothetical protein